MNNNNNNNTPLRTLARSLALLAIAVGVEARAAGAADKTATVWPAAELKWTVNPAIKGAQQAVLWGDPTKGPYGALKKIPAGTELPLHSHTYDHKVVVVAGTIELTVEGRASGMPVGSYALLPGGVKHAARCGAAAECIYLEEGSGTFDMKREGVAR